MEPSYRASRSSASLSTWLSGHYDGGSKSYQPRSTTTSAAVPAGPPPAKDSTAEEYMRPLDELQSKLRAMAREKMEFENRLSRIKSEAADSVYTTPMTTSQSFTSHSQRVRARVSSPVPRLCFWGGGVTVRRPAGTDAPVA